MSDVPPRRVRIAPSILAADFARLAEQVKAVEAAGVEILHLDVMDGHFVPNISFGVPVVAALRRTTKLFLDTHLMIQQPQKYAQAFCEAGADLITVHCECEGDPAAALEIARQAGKKTGIAVNPETPFEQAARFAPDVDLILIMSVHPGFGGQAFIDEVLPKLHEARSMGRPDAWYEIDGGLNGDTIVPAVQAGADVIVAGSAIFGRHDPAAAVQALRQRALAALRAESDRETAHS